MFGLDWFTVIVIGIFTIIFWGIHERGKDAPYNPDRNKTYRYDVNYWHNNLLHPTIDPKANIHLDGQLRSHIDPSHPFYN